MRLALGVLLACSLAGCTPDQAAETIGCDTLADCPLSKFDSDGSDPEHQICDVPRHECIDTPPNRFLGRFHCTINDDSKLEPSEIIGRIEKNRWSLPTAVCKVNTKDFTVSAFGYASSDMLLVRATLADLKDGSAELGLHLEGRGVGAASMENFDTYVGYGYSEAGELTLNAAPKDGAEVDGYLDVTMFPTFDKRGVDDDAIFGVPCPRGRADCGEKTAAIGGAEFCDVALETPICSRLCDDDGDCALAHGECVNGFCTKSCTQNSDCQSPLRCVVGDPGEGSGCF